MISLGLTLWDQKTLQEKTVEISQHSSSFQISASDSIESKSSLLDIDASLKASFLGGLIKVGGSAKYLNDTKKYKNQSRVTLQYNTTTTFKELSLIDLKTMDTQQKDLIKEGSATHVVTGILYGADAFFVFDSEKLEASSVQNIQGGMEAVINNIPAFDVEGKVDIKLTDEEKALTNKFSCKFYGDLILKSNPATFEEAVHAYAELPKLLQQEGNGVALKVWLMPLKSLYLEAAEFKSVSVGVVRKAENALEDLRQIVMRCNDSLADSVGKDFPQICKHLTTFKELCNQYAASLQQTMADQLPLIREGETNESKLEELFEERDMSPFSREKLSNWLDHKEREINVLCRKDASGNIRSSRNQSGSLDKRRVLASGVEDALCFVFTSLETADPVLDEMDKHLDNPLLESTNEVPWYYSDEVLTNMRKKAKAFHDISKVLTKNSRFCFLVAAIANEKYKGAFIYQLARRAYWSPEDFPITSLTS
ncbi:LOW QUALITY PROTEIN: neoverrucotoxin subunit beta-like [Morone saxatilis]|uniref:LOW QUALITY PROTEIN: neoverrucotoxin subunit beta-like n=1 Tax=Morone saxatilis TaxID=34816 RepID=UPI0015E23931|nr:LOW QUALITY PROTEIN: neoverrucotoxin subunit beta-like [Morone saxatilis]